MKRLLLLLALCLLAGSVSGAMWVPREAFGVVSLPNGNIVLAGGDGDSGKLNDVWLSSDGGETWVQKTASAGWSVRTDIQIVVSSTGNITLIGGTTSAGKSNDVWQSSDSGSTWTMLSAAAEWSSRKGECAVSLPNGNIIMMGGFVSPSYKNDVWRSTNNGTNWTQINASAGWSTRMSHQCTALPNGDIILAGGLDSAYNKKNDVWRSTDGGVTWMQMNASAGWAGRYSHAVAALPDNSIIVVGGYSGSSSRWNDTWISSNYGSTWVQVNSSSGWAQRRGLAAVTLPDYKILIMGGLDASVPANLLLNDVWRSTDNGSMWFKSPWFVYGPVNFEGYVNDAETKLVIPGANVSFAQGGNSAGLIADGNGWYSTYGEIEIVTGSSSNINVSKSGYHSYNVSLSPLFNKVIPLNFTLNSTSPSVTGLNIGGVVRDGEFTNGVITHGLGRPIEGATVYVVNNSNAQVFTELTSMTGWYKCPGGSTCIPTFGMPYQVWGNKTGYYDSPEYTVVAT